jgi:hypothetical protein
MQVDVMPLVTDDVMNIVSPLTGSFFASSAMPAHASTTSFPFRYAATWRPTSGVSRTIVSRMARTESLAVPRTGSLAVPRGVCAASVRRARDAAVAVIARPSSTCRRVNSILVTDATPSEWNRRPANRLAAPPKIGGPRFPLTFERNIR